MMLAHLKHSLRKHVKVGEDEEDRDNIVHELIERLHSTIKFESKYRLNLEYEDDSREDKKALIDRMLRKELHARVKVLSHGLSMSSVDEQKELYGNEGWNIEYLMEWCKAKKDASLVVFDSITSHHRALKDATVNKSMSWNDALQSSSANLEAYADAAVFMGEKSWVQEGHKWCELVAEEFFFGNLSKKTFVNNRKDELCRQADGKIDREKLFSLQESFVLPAVRDDSKMNLLDIGSCYNPHSKGSMRHRFEVIALDLFPQDESVLSCDFITVNLADEMSTKGGYLESLPVNYFHVCTLSLVLCYLPTPTERIAMVSKARECLRKETNFSCGGLLLISEKGSIFPTSSLHTRYLNTWKDSMRSIGFALVRYEMKVVEGNKRLHLFAFSRIECVKKDKEGSHDWVSGSKVTAGRVMSPKILCLWKQEFE